jgi:hypothetical protein
MNDALNNKNTKVTWGALADESFSWLLSQQLANGQLFLSLADWLEAQKYQTKLLPADAIDLTLGEGYKPKKAKFEIRHPQDGRKISLAIEALSSKLADFKTIVVPYELASLFGEQHDIYAYISVGDIKSILADLPEHVGVATHVTEDNYLALLDEIASCTKSRWLLKTDDLPLNVLEQLTHIKDCAVVIQTNMPFDFAKAGKVFGEQQIVDIQDLVHQFDQSAIDPVCACSSCQKYTRSYLHHLYSNTPLLCIQLLAQHNFSVWQQLF